MKVKMFFRKMFTLAAVAAIGVVVSCTDDSGQFQQEVADVAEDAITDFYFEDVDDITGVAMLADNSTDDGGRVASGPRVITITDPRFNCSGVVITITMDPESSPTRKVKL